MTKKPYIWDMKADVIQDIICTPYPPLYQQQLFSGYAICPTLIASPWENLAKDDLCRWGSFMYRITHLSHIPASFSKRQVLLLSDDVLNAFPNVNA